MGSFSYGQSSQDYTLYSKVIDSFITNGVKLNIVTLEAVIIEKFIPRDGEGPMLTNFFQDTSDQKLYMFVRYDSVKIKLFRDSLIKNAIITLEKEFSETPKLNQDEFKISCKAKTISQREYQHLFTGKKNNIVTTGWKKFYKMFPGAHGIFKFSKIIYNGDYACFYASRQSNGLSGRGDIVVMKKDNENWRILTYINIWMS